MDLKQELWDEDLWEDNMIEYFTCEYLYQYGFYDDYNFEMDIYNNDIEQKNINIII